MSEIILMKKAEITKPVRKKCGELIKALEADGWAKVPEKKEDATKKGAPTKKAKKAAV